MYLHCIRSLHFLGRFAAFFFFNTQILSTSVTSLWMIFLFNSLIYVRYTFFKMYLLFLGSSQLYVLVYICYIYFCGFPMYLHCIHLLRIFWEMCWFFFSTHRSCPHRLHFRRWFPYLFPLYTFVTLFERRIRFFLDSSQLYVLVYIRYMSWDVFPMYLHCIRSLRFFESLPFFFFSTYRSCLHSLHVKGWFSHVFALYTFVTIFERYNWFLFISAVCTCLGSLHVMGCFSYVFALYTFVTFFWEICWFCFLTYRSCLHSLHVMEWFSYVFALYTFVTLFERCTWFLDSSQLYVLYIHYTYLSGFPIYFCCIHLSLLKDIFIFSPKFDHSDSCLHLTISLLCLRSYTPLRCNEMRPAGNLLSFCALYV